jgi:ABC-type Fe3+/spermidine/putrescine transport system ATPase subunit
VAEVTPKGFGATTPLQSNNLVRKPLRFKPSPNAKSRLRRFHGELTVVVIAHRLSTARNADSIIVLNQGEIVEHGAWQSSFSRPGSLFAKIVQAGAQ